MDKWASMRRARDDLRPNRSVSKLPKILNTILDEIIALKKQVRKLKKKAS